MTVQKETRARKGRNVEQNDHLAYPASTAATKMGFRIARIQPPLNQLTPLNKIEEKRRKTHPKAYCCLCHVLRTAYIKGWLRYDPEPEEPNKGTQISLKMGSRFYLPERCRGSKHLHVYHNLVLRDQGDLFSQAGNIKIITNSVKNKTSLLLVSYLHLARFH